MKKVAKVMREFKAGTLHSGSKKGPKVTNPKQALAIAMSEARRTGVPKYQGKGTRARLNTAAERMLGK